MGLIETMMTMIFGGGRNVVAETVEVFERIVKKGPRGMQGNAAPPSRNLPQNFKHRAQVGSTSLSMGSTACRDRCWRLGPSGCL